MKGINHSKVTTVRKDKEKAFLCTGPFTGAKTQECMNLNEQTLLHKLITRKILPWRGGEVFFTPLRLLEHNSETTKDFFLKLRDFS